MNAFYSNGKKMKITRHKMETIEETEKENSCCVDVYSVVGHSSEK